MMKSRWKVKCMKWGVDRDWPTLADGTCAEIGGCGSDECYVLTDEADAAALKEDG